MPRMLRNSLVLVGGGVSSTFLRSGFMLPSLKMKPKNSRDDLLNSHLFALRVRLLSETFCRTWLRVLSWLP